MSLRLAVATFIFSHTAVAIAFVWNLRLPQLASITKAFSSHSYCNLQILVTQPKLSLSRMQFFSTLSIRPVSFAQSSLIRWGAPGLLPLSSFFHCPEVSTSLFLTFVLPSVIFTFLSLSLIDASTIFVSRLTPETPQRSMARTSVQPRVLSKLLTVQLPWSM